MAEERRVHVLYYSWFCPFAQRAWIALLEKKVPFEKVDIDPYNKTPDFLAINPRGLVPTIVQPDGKTVYESMVCIEYLDELKPEVNPLLPTDPWERAHVRIWADYISKYIVPGFYRLLMNQVSTKHGELKQDFLEHLAKLESAVDDKGPFFMGEKLGLVDIMVWPYLYRTELILGTYRDTKIPDSDEFRKLRKIYAHGLKHPSIQPTMADENQLVAKYKRYHDNTAKTEVTA